MFTFRVRVTAFVLLALATVFIVGSLFAQNGGQRLSKLNAAKLKASAAPDLMGGIAYPGGAFDLSKNPTCMLIGDFKFPSGLKFVHTNMTYYGEYTDPQYPEISGHLYHIKLAKFERYFLVGKAGISGTDDTQRWVADYEADGTPRWYQRGTFALKP